jgi:nucleoside-diphosphate-sugar epimerase
MKIVITGGAGFLGRKLARRLLERGQVVGPDGTEASIEEILLFDVAAPPAGTFADPRISVVTGDIADAATLKRVIDSKTSSIFHLAAVVSGQAEADTDLGYRVNLDGTRAVLEACRALGTRPRVVFASSVAVYGGNLPAVVLDKTPLTPATSYGTQKAMGELLVNDYSRKGFIDGRALRLPTISVRPGRPNRAASGFASSLFREPLSGVSVSCPVSMESAMVLLSPRRAVAAFEQVHDLPGSSFGPYRGLLLPGISVTVAQMVEALHRAGGEEAMARIRWEPDPEVQQIVDGWPRELRAERAQELGITADASMDEIVKAFVEDDLAEQKQLVASQS